MRILRVMTESLPSILWLTGKGVKTLRKEIPLILKMPEREKIKNEIFRFKNRKKYYEKVVYFYFDSSNSKRAIWAKA